MHMTLPLNQLKEVNAVNQIGNRTRFYFDKAR